MNTKVTKEFANYMEQAFNRKFRDNINNTSIPISMRVLLETEGEGIVKNIIETDKKVSDIEELIDLLISKYWEGILDNYEKAV